MFTWGWDTAKVGGGVVSADPPNPNSPLQTSLHLRSTRWSCQDWGSESESHFSPQGTSLHLSHAGIHRFDWGQDLIDFPCQLRVLIFRTEKHKTATNMFGGCLSCHFFFNLVWCTLKIYFQTKDILVIRLTNWFHFQPTNSTDYWW